MHSLIALLTISCRVARTGSTLIRAQEQIAWMTSVHRSLARSATESKAKVATAKKYDYSSSAVKILAIDYPKKLIVTGCFKKNTPKSSRDMSKTKTLQN